MNAISNARRAFDPFTGDSNSCCGCVSGPRLAVRSEVLDCNVICLGCGCRNLKNIFEKIIGFFIFFRTFFSRGMDPGTHNVRELITNDLKRQRDSSSTCSDHVYDLYDLHESWSDEEKNDPDTEPVATVDAVDDDDKTSSLPAFEGSELPTVVFQEEHVLRLWQTLTRSDALADSDRFYAGLVAHVSNRIAKLKTRHGVRLLVDTHEHDLIRFFEHQPWVQVYTLPTCDFVFVDRSGRPLVGYERKTQADLAQSVKAKNKEQAKEQRLKKQKQNMKDLKAVQVGVILEGEFTGSRMFELNCESKTVLRDMMHWIRTNCLLDTVLMLYRYALALFELGPSFGTQHSFEHYETFDGVHKSKTSEEQFVMMLSCVPSFSAAKAKALTAVYPNMSALVNGFDAKRVSNTMYQPKKSDKRRKIGPSSTKRLQAVLFGPDHHQQHQQQHERQAKRQKRDK